MFDVSAQVPPTSWYGTLLKGTVNWNPAPTVLEATVWVVYLVVVMTLFLRRPRGGSPAPAPRPRSSVDA